MLRHRSYVLPLFGLICPFAVGAGAQMSPTPNGIFIRAYHSSCGGDKV